MIPWLQNKINNPWAIKITGADQLDELLKVLDVNYYYYICIVIIIDFVEKRDSGVWLL